MILTASYGEGHVQVSRTLQHCFLAKDVQEVQIIDLMKEAHPLLNSISTRLYLKSTRTSQYGLDFYGWSYYMTRDASPDGSLSKYFNSLGKKKLKEMIKKARPDVIVNTFPFGAASEIGRDLSIPTCTVLTDYALHARWIQPYMNKYYVATEELKAELVAREAAVPHQIEVTGIPVRSGFYAATAVRNRFLPMLDRSKELVLISAGSYGVLHHIEEIARTLLAKGNCQLAVVCGRNQKMEQKLRILFEHEPDVHIFGFVSQIHELMALSSCIVTKAGGVTLSEALSLMLPVFIFKPFAGQEKENALYFANKGIANIANNAQELGEQLDRLLSNPVDTHGMKKRMAALFKGEAAELIVNDIMQTIGERLSVTV
nr:glycosyltransferase [Paenibacillus caui]